MSAANDDSATVEPVREQPAPPPPPEPALHPFFMKTSEKKKQMQAAAAAAKAAQQPPAKPKRTRKAKASGTPKRRSPRNAKTESPVAAEESSSQIKDLPSIRTEIDRITAAAAPPPIDTKKATTLAISPPRRSPKMPQFPKPNFGGLKPAFGLGAAGREPKLPGMVEAQWPARGTSHIRGLEPSEDSMEDIIFSGDEPIFRERKLKDARMVITPEENILSNLARKLNVDNILADIRSEDYEERKYFEVPPEVRLPQRLITTGSELQEMVRPRISARLPHPKALYQQLQQQDEDSDTDTDMALPRMDVHPALLSLYRRLGTELTPFDLHKFEPTSWEVKYAPQMLAEVLQHGRETDIIRDWLTELRTDKVHAGGGGGGRGKRKSKPKATTAKKKRKKGGDLDGFVVDSEEEANLMDELREPTDDDWLNPSPKTKKSSVRAGDKMAELLGKNKDRKTNTVVISGPTGCGKTAAIYAAAKELGYAVFEVNSGSRRSGKDVLDMVGDMSRNHQVRNKSVLDSSIDNPFTRAKASKAPVVAHEEDAQMRQRQSLILFEEVDILFEEDKSFWTTVISLMSKSKRPIVLTCNDESLLPWDDLSLHAILRFSVPPRDLLVDHLLLMAANEGHFLQRPAVDALVQANGNDIRASIMSLQFHCRMAIGDRKGGLGWLVDRFPAGCDIAANGEKTRVVSVDTYRLGMGMVPHIPEHSEDDKWKGLWEEYGDLDIMESADGLEECTSLEVSEAFFEARSAADAFAPLSTEQPKLDPSLPKRSRNTKTLLDDPYGYKTVQTDPLIVPGSVSTSLSTTTYSLARSYAHLPSPSSAALIRTLTPRPDPVTRMQLQSLFAPLSKADTPFASTPASIHSCIYPSVRTLAVEVAPAVRTILRGDMEMELERRKKSSLLSKGGKRRTTRAARLAGEGGDRRRRERWFRGLDADVVAMSAGVGWEGVKKDEDVEVEG